MHAYLDGGSLTRVSVTNNAQITISNATTKANASATKEVPMKSVLADLNVSATHVLMKKVQSVFKQR